MNKETHNLKTLTHLGSVLAKQVKNFPQKPGVYQFLNQKNEVIYIGKAKNLKARVKQYFSGSDERPQIPYLLKEATKIEYTVVKTELESLYLENTLIKQHLPKYNIMLRDDKNYAFIKIDYSTQIPQILTVRKVDSIGRHSEIVNPNEESQKNTKGSSAPQVHLSARKTGLELRMTPSGKFFGPFSAKYKIRQTLNLVRRIFPFCANEKVSNRPCFYYYLHRCPGVCIGKTSLGDYQKQINRIALFLSGKTAQIKKELLLEMNELAKSKKFESAARLRDQIRSLNLLEEKQMVILTKKVSWDVVSFANLETYSCVNLFKVREGKLTDKENFVFDTKPLPASPYAKGRSSAETPLFSKEGSGELMQSFLEKYYSETTDLPKEIYLEQLPGNISIVELLLKERTGGGIKITQPKKSKPLDLVKLGTENAREYLKKYLIDQGKYLDEINNALSQLKTILHLSKIPSRIECYDISNIQGTNAVGSMVVFENGKPAKNQYRKFKIRSKDTPDDFEMMREMLTRRMARISSSVIMGLSADKSDASEESQSSFVGSTPQSLPRASQGDDAGWPMPDLIVIDGGKGQLSVALEVLQKLQMTNFKFQIIGLAKRIEEIFVPNQSNPILLDHTQPALKLLQRMRDEAHRFGITFHRNLRSKQAVQSALDSIPGIGPKTKKLLKQKFGTVKNIRNANIIELKKIVGSNLAKSIKQRL